MNVQALRTISKLRKVNQTRLAEMAGVSRQAVSQWFKAPNYSEVNVQSLHLKYLAKGLEVHVEDLLNPLPVLDNLETVERYETTFLWDALYSNLADFSIALVRGEESAIARLVQVLGLYKASKLLGKKVWNRFPDYKKIIRPVRREQLEKIWELHKNQVSD